MSKPNPNFSEGDTVKCPKGGVHRKVQNRSFSYSNSEWKYSLRGTLETYPESELQKVTGDEYKDVT